MSKMTKMSLMLAVGLMASAGAAHAVSSYSVTSNLISDATWLDWSDNLTVAKFDQHLGTLNSIRFELTGKALGDAGVESTDALASTITIDVAAKLTLMRPDSSTLVVTQPFGTQVFNASAWDGSTDYAGSSGQSYSGLVATATNFATTSSASDLALFSGPGQISMQIDAEGTSTIHASANQQGFIDTTAGAYAKVTYFYAAAPVPEPETWALMLAGIAAIGSIASRRRRQA